jgi:hypothetical protein
MDRREGAAKVLTTHHAGGDTDSPLVTLQMQEMITAIQEEVEFAKNTKWADMVKTKGNRHHAWVSISLGVAAQPTGQ